MTATRRQATCVLRPQDVNPSRNNFEVCGVFNPGAAIVNGQIVLAARVAEQPAEQRPGQVGLPRWDPGRGTVVDWMRQQDVEHEDPRVVRVKSTGALRLTFLSHIRTYRSSDGTSFQEIAAGRLVPQMLYEVYGLEDPRITHLDGRYYITYVAVGPHGAATALASTLDFRGFERHGIIFPPENKDVVLFPERIGGRYFAVHRPNPRMHFSPPGMWLASSPDLLNWGQHEPLCGGHAEWERGRTGAGPPPLPTEHGWLLLYHGKAPDPRPGVVGPYSAGALLLDLRDPSQALARSREPVMTPEAEFEQAGFVPGVVFPTGVVSRGDRLLIYYGAADRYTGLREFRLSDLLDAVH